MTIVALIPARAGSKRIPGKNTKLLAGHPLIAYTIAAAQQSGIFARVIVATDEAQADDVAQAAGATVFWREAAPDDQPDIVWVREVLAMMTPPADVFAILRPTSPFRTAATIQRAWAEFQANQPADSLRAIRRVREHPGKMWWISHSTYGHSGRPRLAPVCADDISTVCPSGTRWHSSPTQSLPAAFIQTGSLEMAWTRIVRAKDSISGDVIVPFLSEDYESLDLNTLEDWTRAEHMIAQGVALPLIDVPCPR